MSLQRDVNVDIDGCPLGVCQVGGDHDPALKVILERHRVLLHAFERQGLACHAVLLLQMDTNNGSCVKDRLLHGCAFSCEHNAAVWMRSVDCGWRTGV